MSSYNEYKEYTIPTDATFLLFSMRVGNGTDGSADRNSGDDDHVLKVYYDGVFDGSLKLTYTQTKGLQRPFEPKTAFFRLTPKKF